MATDRSLATLLRALQSPSGEQDASRCLYKSHVRKALILTLERLLESATIILTLLSNPLNVSLLVSQLLTAPAIWYRTSGTQAESRILDVFNAASLEKIRQENTPQIPGAYSAREGLSKEAWIKAVVLGADEKSPRWKHMLVIGGLLLGFESHERHGLPKSLRRTLENALIKATNLALQDVKDIDDPSRASISIIFGYVFDVLDVSVKIQVLHDLLLPLLIETMLFSKLGLHWGYFLGVMDVDVSQDGNSKFGWSSSSQSYAQVQRMASSPVLVSLGRLSRLVAFCISRVKDENLIYKTTQNLEAFTRSLCVQWQQNKLSEVDITEERLYLSEEFIRNTLPLVWQVLKSVLFAIIIMETSLMGRVMGDGIKPPLQGRIRFSECILHFLISIAPFVATLALNTLRNLYFVSSRLGQNAFSQYQYVYMSSIDILSSYPTEAEAFLQLIRPQNSSNIPEHPQERCNDLFFLNVAEHFMLYLPTSIADELFIPVAFCYLGAGNDRRLIDSLEAAHSVMLAVFSCPQNHALVRQHLPFYIATLFGVS